MGIPITVNNLLNSVKSSGTGELASLHASPYELTTLRYPIEGLGGEDTPHYVVFNINLPESSKYLKANENTTVQNANIPYNQNLDILQRSNPTQADGGILKTAAAAALSTLAGTFSLEKAGKTALGTTAAAAISEAVTIKNKLKRIDTSIAIYMPETVITQYEHNWDAVSLTTAMGALGQNAALGGDLVSNLESLGKTTGDNVRTSGGKPYNNYDNGVAAETAARIAKATGQVGEGFSELALRSAGRALNPQVEMVFTGTQNRTYVFEFDFQPRSQKEAKEIFNIIKVFKGFAAPEIATEGKGRYFIPPAEFDIRFFFKNTENPIIAKISTCALVSIAVDYNRTGPFATFNDGMPVHIHVTLQFKEMDIITRELINEYGY